MVFRGARDCCVNIENKSADPDVEANRVDPVLLVHYEPAFSLEDAQRPETTFDMYH